MRNSLLATGAVLTLLALTGCSGGQSDGGQSAEAPAAARADGDEATDNGQASPVDIRLESPDMRKTGHVAMIGKDLGGIRDDLDALLLEYAGTVSGEETRNDDEGRPLTSTLVIRVPSQHFYAVMLALKANSATKSTDIQTEDLHAQVVDVGARLDRLRASHKRLSAFLEAATDVDTLLDYERRLTEVETQLATLTAQRDALTDQTSLSTITVQMRTPEAPAPKKDDPLEDAGFLTGLSNGWSALQDVLLVVATVVGAVLPFAVLGAVGGVPVWLLLRRRSARGGLVDEVGEPG